MSNIKGIFFDAAGVFYDRRETTGAFANRLLADQSYRVQLTEEETARKKTLRVQATEGHIGHDEYWEQLLLMHAVLDREKRDALKQRILAHTHEVFAYPGAASTLAALKERGFILGIVTDTIYPVEWKMRWLAKVGVAPFIDIVSCSSTLGAHKPEPAIYLNALVQARLTPPEAAFVGHDAGELEGARRAGMATVAVNHNPDARADYYCAALPDLLNVPIFQKELRTNAE